MGIVVIGDVFIDIKGYSLSPYIRREEMPERSFRSMAE